MGKLMVGLARFFLLCALVSIFLSGIAVQPAQAKLGPISIRSVFTTDENQNNKDVFIPGDKINYHVDVDNTTGSTFPIDVRFQVFANSWDPRLYSYDQTYRVDQMPVGLSRFYNPVTLPSDAASYWYILRITITPSDCYGTGCTNDGDWGESTFTITSPVSCPSLQPSSGYWYVMGHQCHTATGTYAAMSQHKPYINPESAKKGGHSLAEIAAIYDSSDGRDAIEVGWIVWPDLFKDDLPHLFIFKTVGSQTSGESCYVWKNGDCGWVQEAKVDKDNPGPGWPVVETSTPQSYKISYSASEGRWLVFYRDVRIGYFPASLWPRNRFTQITQGRWYGEVSAGDLSFSQGVCTAMGNVTYGSKPDPAKPPAVITGMGFINANGSQPFTQANAIPYITDKSYYDMGEFSGDRFTYGGPGRCAIAR